MRNCAIIVDNRLSNKELDKVVERHVNHLPGWACVSLNPERIRNSEDYNRYLTSVEFWGSLQEWNKILIFQHDSGILRNGIDEFMEWDYVGAPWKMDAPWAHPERKGGNGGLSLRCPKKALSLIHKKPYSPSYGNEDVYFSRYLEEVNGKVAPYEVCKTFSVETEFCAGTFGYHAIDKHLSSSQCEEIFKQYINEHDR